MLDTPQDRRPLKVAQAPEMQGLQIEAALEWNFSGVNTIRDHSIFFVRCCFDLGSALCQYTSTTVNLTPLWSAW